MRSILFRYDSAASSSHAINVMPGQVAPAPSSSSSSFTAFGLLDSGYGASYGYFLTGHVQLGAAVSFSHNHSSVPGPASSSNNTLSLTPRLEYALNGTAMRPYLAVFGGYSRMWGSSKGSDFNGHYERSGFVFGGAIGTHWFITDSWSLDPELGVTRAKITSNSSFDGANAGQEMSDDYRSTALTLSLGLSGWH